MRVPDSRIAPSSRPGVLLRKLLRAIPTSPTEKSVSPLRAMYMHRPQGFAGRLR